MALGGKVLRQMAEWAPDGTDLMPEALTGWELMRFHAWCGISGCLHGQQAMLYAEELANRFALQPAPGQLTGSYSFGMKRKLQLICCLMRRPDFVIVDEPRNGLDPVTADEVAAVLQEHRQHGAVIVTATHDLDFAARESTHVAVLLRGMLKAVGSRDQVFADKDPRERYRELVSQ
jgi:ABC-2 type transport system ATP-binding protein